MWQGIAIALAIDAARKDGLLREGIDLMNDASETIRSLRAQSERQQKTIARLQDLLAVARERADNPVFGGIHIGPDDEVIISAIRRGG